MTTFVLVHGAWHGAWCWERVRPLLEAHGHEVVTPEPGATWLGNGQAPYTESMQGAYSLLQFDNQGHSEWNPDDAASLFCNDCPPADAKDTAFRLRPDSAVIYTQECPALPGRRVPTAYITCQQDRVLDGTWNASRAAELLNAAVHPIDAGHSPFWSAPEQLATLISQLA